MLIHLLTKKIKNNLKMIKNNNNNNKNKPKQKRTKIQTLKAISMLKPWHL